MFVRIIEVITLIIILLFVKHAKGTGHDEN